MILSDRVSGKLSLWGILTVGCLALAAAPAWSWAENQASPTPDDAAVGAGSSNVDETGLPGMPPGEGSTIGQPPGAGLHGRSSPAGSAPSDEAGLGADGDEMSADIRRLEAEVHTLKKKMLEQRRQARTDSKAIPHVPPPAAVVPGQSVFVPRTFKIDGKLRTWYELTPAPGAISISPALPNPLALPNAALRDPPSLEDSNAATGRQYDRAWKGQRSSAANPGSSPGMPNDFGQQNAPLRGQPSPEESNSFGSPSGSNVNEGAATGRPPRRGSTVGQPPGAGIPRQNALEEGNSFGRPSGSNNELAAPGRTRQQATAGQPPANQQSANQPLGAGLPGQSPARTGRGQPSPEKTEPSGDPARSDADETHAAGWKHLGGIGIRPGFGADALPQGKPGLELKVGDRVVFEEQPSAKRQWTFLDDTKSPVVVAVKGNWVKLKGIQPAGHDLKGEPCWVNFETVAWYAVVPE